MSLLRYNKNCPHCQHPIVINLDVNKPELETKWECPNCKKKFLFKDHSYTEHELLSLTAAQSMNTNALLVRHARQQHTTYLESVKTNELLTEQNRVQRWTNRILILIFLATGGSVAVVTTLSL